MLENRHSSFRAEYIKADNCWLGSISPSTVYNQAHILLNLQLLPKAMAPGLIESTAEFFKPVSANKAIFPDGYKTSGQQEPIYSLIQPYEKFPKHIEGVTAWTAADFKNSPEKWTYGFTEEELVEIGSSADKFIESGVPLTGITKVCPNFFVFID
jgi:hypothetical protein